MAKDKNCKFGFSSKFSITEIWLEDRHKSVNWVKVDKFSIAVILLKDKSNQRKFTKLSKFSILKFDYYQVLILLNFQIP